MKKAKPTISIGIVASFGGSSKKEYKIVTMLTSGSTVTLTTVGDTRRAGTNYIPSRVLKQMFETNGQRVIEEQKENGNEHF
jgi:hypothetical protein